MRKVIICLLALFFLFDITAYAAGPSGGYGGSQGGRSGSGTSYGGSGYGGRPGAIRGPVIPIRAPVAAAMAALIITMARAATMDQAATVATAAILAGIPITGMATTTTATGIPTGFGSAAAGTPGTGARLIPVIIRIIPTTTRTHMRPAQLPSSLSFQRPPRTRTAIGTIARTPRATTPMSNRAREAG